MNSPIIREIDLSSVITSSTTRDEIRALVPRAALDVAGAMKDVQAIIEQVRTEGVQALIDLGERFDGIRPQSLRVPAAELQNALSS